MFGPNKFFKKMFNFFYPFVLTIYLTHDKKKKKQLTPIFCTNLNTQPTITHL